MCECDDCDVAALREKIPDCLLDLSDEEAEATKDLIEDATERHDDPKRMTLGERVDAHQTSLGIMMDDHGDLEERVVDLEDDRETVEEAAEQAEEAVDRVETFETHGLKDTETQETYEGVGELDLEWMERFAHLGRDEVEPDANRTQHRVKDIHAKVLFENLPDWAFEAHDGDIVLRTGDGLRAKLSRKLDTDLEYSELYRACEALGDRMGTKITWLDDNPKIGKHLRIDASDVEDVALDLSVVDRPKETTAKGRAQKAALFG